MSDLLFQLRNSFWVGNFEEAINEARGLSANGNEVERDFYRMRAELEQGSLEVSVDTSLPSALQAVQLLAAHRSGSVGEEQVKLTLDSWIEDENTAENPLVQIIAATLYNRIGDWNKALTVLRSEATLEQYVLLLFFVFNLLFVVCCVFAPFFDSTFVVGIGILAGNRSS